MPHTPHNPSPLDLVSRELQNPKPSSLPTKQQTARQADELAFRDMLMSNLQPFAKDWSQRTIRAAKSAMGCDVAAIIHFQQEPAIPGEPAGGSARENQSGEVAIVSIMEADDKALTVFGGQREQLQGSALAYFWAVWATLGTQHEGILTDCFLDPNPQARRDILEINKGIICTKVCVFIKTQKCT